MEAWIASIFERELVTDGTLVQHSAQAAELWTLREGITESLTATGRPHKNDIALPIAALEAFCVERERFFEQSCPGWEIALFGHIDDGNLHVNVMKPDDLSKEAFLARTKEADHAIFTLVKKHTGASLPSTARACSRSPTSAPALPDREREREREAQLAPRRWRASPKRGPAPLARVYNPGRDRAGHANVDRTLSAESTASWAT